MSRSLISLSIHRLFQHGVDMDVSKLYPRIEFPVSRGTPMISPSIKWNHEENHYVPHFDSYNTFERRNFVLNISDKKFEYIQGHMIDGRVLFPATGWIVLVWETFSMMIGAPFEKVKVVLDEVRFLRATSLNKNQDVLITISIHRGTGSFEVIEGSAAVCLGYIKQVDDITMSEITELSDENTVTLPGDDLYKEMRLRGFLHLGAFKGVKEIRHDGLKGKIKWNNNWITFIDSMTHFEELETNSRALALPTNIRKIVIDPFLQHKMLEEKQSAVLNGNNQSNDASEQEILYDVAISPYLRIIQAGGVEIHDKRNRVVNRRRPREPLLETYQFVPFSPDDTKFSTKNAMKIIVHMALENYVQRKFTTLEIDHTTDETDVTRPLSELLSKALRETPVVISKVTLLTSKEEVRLDNVTISREEASTFTGVDILIRSKCLDDNEFIENAKSILSENGYILSRELSEDAVTSTEHLRLVTKLQTDDGEFLHLLQFENNSKTVVPENVIEITSNVEDWLNPLKESLKNGPTIIFSQSTDSSSGIIGFFNCIRREFLTESIKCFLITDSDAPPFDVKNSFYHSQLILDHPINVLKGGKWGSYRYLDMLPELNSSNGRESHLFANCLIKGDLSTLTWLNGPLNVNDNNPDIIRIQYASLNFKDIMLALGRIPDTSCDLVGMQCVLGLEFSGIKFDGKRVMGIGLNAGALATHYDAKQAMLWDVPESWSLEEAATVPIVYFTVYFAFFITTTIQKGKSILIHSGSGGVGQAAIQVAFNYGLVVFTTVSTAEKRDFLLAKFPQLKAENIGNSRDTTFEKMVMENTKGKGVDYVLNSLADEKLQASIRVLGMGGTLLEIGKYDMLNGTKLDMRYLTKRINFKAVIFDDLQHDAEEMKVRVAGTLFFVVTMINSWIFFLSMKTVYNLVNDDIARGVIKPLNTTIFDANDVEEAFRFMANGKHIGKVLLKVRQHENEAVSLPLAAINRVYCDPNKSFVIVGGLGGFGIELAEWLVHRGCKKLVLSSSRGFTNNNQFVRIE